VQGADSGLIPAGFPSQGLDALELKKDTEKMITCTDDRLAAKLAEATP
jgi:hypothetical protein